MYQNLAQSAATAGTTVTGLRTGTTITQWYYSAARLTAWMLPPLVSE